MARRALVSLVCSGCWCFFDFMIKSLSEVFSIFAFHLNMLSTFLVVFTHAASFFSISEEAILFALSLSGQVTKTIIDDIFESVVFFKESTSVDRKEDIIENLRLFL